MHNFLSSSSCLIVVWCITQNVDYVVISDYYKTNDAYLILHFVFFNCGKTKKGSFLFLFGIFL